MRVRCRTTFDITVTGVRGNFNHSRLPFTDQSGTLIKDEGDWHRARNQQRNWETINQLISLRTLPHSITMSRQIEVTDIPMWEFDFNIDQDTAFARGDEMFGSLKIDCQDVPMIVNLNEAHGQIPMLKLDSNIWFQKINGK